MSDIINSVRKSYQGLYQAGLITKENIMNKEFMKEENWDYIDNHEDRLTECISTETIIGDDQGLDFLG